MNLQDQVAIDLVLQEPLRGSRHGGECFRSISHDMIKGIAAMAAPTGLRHVFPDARSGIHATVTLAIRSAIIRARSTGIEMFPPLDAQHHPGG